ncbi:MAG: DUF664 domain-containing protein [bacterium]
MSETILSGPPPATLAILLDDPDAHDFPAVARILGDLTPQQATTTPPGLPYSVARIVAHMDANMRFNLGLIRASAPAAYDERFESWPEVSAEGWPALLEEFFTHLRALTQVAREAQDLDRVLYPATDKDPSWTVGYKLACSVAKHNAYHLGQIVVLRRLIGAWEERARAPADS